MRENIVGEIRGGFPVGPQPPRTAKPDKKSILKGFRRKSSFVSKDEINKCIYELSRSGNERVL